MKKKKKVCILMPSFFDYLTHDGCAVETLVTIIGEYNEIYGNIELDVIAKNGSIGIKLNCYDYLLLFLYRIIKKIIKKRVFYFNRYYYKCHSIIKRNNYDYIIYEAGDLETFKSVFKNIPSEKLIYHIHHDLRTECKNNLDIIDCTFQKYIGVSEFVVNVAKQVLKDDGKKFMVLKNSTDDKLFINHVSKNNIRKKMGFDDDDFVILYVGRLIKEKGIFELCTAVNELKNSKIKLLIIGSAFSSKEKDTPFIVSLKKIVENNVDNIKFTGFISHYDIVDYYASASVQVIPSICEEAAGLVAIEGMLCGVPIIATNSGGMIEYLNPKTSIIINKDDNLIFTLKQVLFDLFRDKKKYNALKKRCRQYNLYYNSFSYYNNFCDIIDRL